MTTKDKIASLEARIAELENKLQEKSVKTAKKATKKTEKTTKKATKKTENGTIKAIQYSEKSVALIGDTKPIKDMIKSCGGRFCARLNIDGTPTAGWIFNMTNWDKAQKALSKINA